jgi:Icc-related predicted phosphoesterase
MSKVSLVLISDTHGFHEGVNLPEGDVLIHAGDFMNSGTRIKELTDFIKWWNTRPHQVKILVAGNHDILVEEKPELLKSLLYGTDYLLDSGVEYFGLKFWGSPFQPRFYDWAFNVDRGEAIKKHWDLIPDDMDVLITHGPPYGILDQAFPSQNSEKCGCEELLDVITKIRPKIHAFGHIHSTGPREASNGCTYFINASQVDEAYRLVNRPIVIELENGR